MSSLKGDTEIALGEVLRLIPNGITREDFDAVERHDEAALTTLDVNEENIRMVCSYFLLFPG